MFGGLERNCAPSAIAWFDANRSPRPTQQKNLLPSDATLIRARAEPTIKLAGNMEWRT